MKSKPSASEIHKAIIEYKSGKDIDLICKELSISKSTFYQLENQYLGTQKNNSDSFDSQSGLPDMDFRKLLGCG